MQSNLDATIASLGLARTRMLNQKLSHETRRYSEEVVTARPCGLPPPEQADVGLVHQVRRLPRMVAVLTTQSGGCQNFQLGIHDTNQRLGRSGVAAGIGFKKLRDVGQRRGGGHGA